MDEIKENGKEKNGNKKEEIKDTEKDTETKAGEGEEKKEDAKAESREANSEKAEKAPESEKSGEEKEDKKDLLDDIIDEGDLILENQRVSIPLTPQNSRFFRSKGNLISLELTEEGKEPEFFERILILRSFPITNPDEFLSVRQPDSRKQGRGKEIGMIRRITDFDEATGRLFLEELDRRYFSPQLLKITSCKEKFGYSYWEAETTAGNVMFILNNPFSNIRVLEDGRIIINDIDGNSFEIPDPNKLDSASYKKIEIYL